MYTTVIKKPYSMFNLVDNFRQEILWTLSTSSSYELVMRCWPTYGFFRHNNTRKIQ